MNQTAREQIMESGDILSLLPKDIIHHILSFLPTKHVVQTCVLSKTWRSVWKSVRHLQFDEELFYGDGEAHEDRAQMFTKFVNTFFLLFQGSSIKTFCVSCSRFCDLDSVFYWIWGATMYKVQEVEISIQSERLSWPDCLFVCQSLRVLKIHFHGWPLRLPDSIDLPQLKTLSLHSITFDDNNFSCRLLSNCPNLENLTLTECDLYNPGPSFDILTSNLKVLVLNSFVLSDLEHTEPDFEIKIVAPKLESFVYNGLIAPRYHLPHLPSLRNAAIDFRFPEWSFWDYSDTVITIFRAITAVKTLYLSDVIIWAMRFCYEDLNLPMLRNLTELNLSAKIDKRQRQDITRLLQNVPNLESLKLDIIPDFSTGSLSPEELCRDLVLCNLKVVEIKNVSADQNHVMLVWQILTSACNLESMTIVLSSLNLVKRRLVTQCIEELARGSTNSVIEIRFGELSD